MFNITKPLKTTEMKKSLLLLTFLLPSFLFAQYSIKECGKKPREPRKTSSSQSQEEFEATNKYLTYVDKYNTWKSCVDDLNSSRPYSRLMKQDDNGFVFVDSVIQVEGVSKDELYNRAKEWVATVFNSAPDVLKLDNKEGGKMIVKGLTDIYSVYSLYTSKSKCFFTIKIFCKESRFKVIVTDFVLQNYPDEYNYNPKRVPYDKFLVNPYEEDGLTPNEHIARVKESMIELADENIISLEKFMQKSASIQDEDDW